MLLLILDNQTVVENQVVTELKFANASTDKNLSLTEKETEQFNPKDSCGCDVIASEQSSQIKGVNQSSEGNGKARACLQDHCTASNLDACQPTACTDHNPVTGKEVQDQCVNNNRASDHCSVKNTKKETCFKEGCKQENKFKSAGKIFKTRNTPNR